MGALLTADHYQKGYSQMIGLENGLDIDASSDQDSGDLFLLMLNRMAKGPFLFIVIRSCLVGLLPCEIEGEKCFSDEDHCNLLFLLVLNRLDMSDFAEDRCGKLYFQTTVI
jgi:hypothetical protein